MIDTETKLYQAIHAQPQAVQTLLLDDEKVKHVAERLAGTRRIFLVGIGTSFHAAQVGAHLLRLAGADAWAVHSFEFVHYPRPLHTDESVIVISHRGSKLYSVQALQQALVAHPFTVGITGLQSPLQGADITLETVAQDPSSAHSISYTSALTRLAQLAAAIAAQLGHTETAQDLHHDLERIPALMEDILSREDLLRSVAHEAIQQQRRIYFIGAGPNAATAPEGALKAKEAAYITTEGFELEQAIHGPMIAFEEHDLVVPISIAGPTQTRMADFLLAQHDIGTQLLLLGEVPNTQIVTLFAHSHWQHFPLYGDETLLEQLTPLLAALPVQLLANFLAIAHGTNPDSFRLDNERYKRANGHLRL